MKSFAFINTAAKKEFNKLPKDIREQFATSINAVVQGEDPLTDFEHIGKSVGKGAIELKINGSPAFRSIYCAKYNDTVYILHSFSKTTNGVDKKAMKTAKERYKLIE